LLNGQGTDKVYTLSMKLLVAPFICIALLCTGCSGSGSSELSFEESVTEACYQVQLGVNAEGIDNQVRNGHFLEAARLFRNLSSQNQSFTDYAEGLNAWATDRPWGMINDVFNFCGTNY
jgi:hypothetical protein